jgi:16S rRNA (cytosine1402-N4)-methyltransferase
MKYPHDPVMIDRVLDLFSPVLSTDSACALDMTLGMGGHSEALLEKFPLLRLVGIDRDDAALAIAKDRLSRFGNRVSYFRGTYDQIPEVCKEKSVVNFQAILADLGVSSLQLDDQSRGFSYSKESNLDMRMDATSELTAFEIVNNYSRTQLVQILRTFGEEKFADRVVNAILRERPITSSVALAEIVRNAIPAATRRTGGHPAKRAFQALRIAVNDELSILDQAIPRALSATSVGGRCVVLSYHSLEDRIVKRYFTQACTSQTPHRLPIEIAPPKFAMVARGEKPTSSEVVRNSRANSAILRAVERVAA